MNSGKWEDEVKKTVVKHADQKEKWTTVFDVGIKRVYGPEDIKDMNFGNDIGYPGQFLRGNQSTGYRGKYWTFRMFSGMGTAVETNQRVGIICCPQDKTGLVLLLIFQL